jgi:hypothetical protein
MSVPLALLVLGTLLAGLLIGRHRNQLGRFPIQLVASVGLTWIVGLSIIQPPAKCKAGGAA